MSESLENTYYERAIDEKLDWGDRYNAILKLNDEELVEKIVTRALDPDIRNIAVRKVENQELLAEIVLLDVDVNVREAALESLANWQRDTFKKVAKDDSSWLLRRGAVERLPGIYDDFFAELLLRELDFRVRRAIMRKLKMINLSIEKLEELTLKAQDSEVRAAASRMIEGEERLTRIAITVGDYVIAEEMIEKIQDQNLLKVIAVEADFAHTRMRAVQRIDDDIFLSLIVKSDKNLVVRGSAVYAIKSVETLETIKMLNDLELVDDVNERMKQLQKL